MHLYKVESLSVFTLAIDYTTITYIERLYQSQQYLLLWEGIAGIDVQQQMYATT